MKLCQFNGVINYFYLSIRNNKSEVLLDHSRIDLTLEMEGYSPLAQKKEIRKNKEG